jgi:formate dehydrogenase subunit delta
MDAAKLTRMANQIAAFFRHEGVENGAASTLKHVLDFWDPRMRQAMRAHLAAGGEGLEPIARRAMEQLAQREADKEPLSNSGEGQG